MHRTDPPPGHAATNFDRQPGRLFPPRGGRWPEAGWGGWDLRGASDPFNRAPLRRWRATSPARGEELLALRQPISTDSRAGSSPLRGGRWPEAGWGGWDLRGASDPFN